MSVIGSSILAGASGSAGGDKVYVDDVFSTNLWNGNYDTTRSAIAINVGFDLDGEGGLVWTKNRNYGNQHQLYDTERNAGNVLYSSLSNGQGSNSVFNSFNSNGFSLTAGTAGTDALNGDAADTYVSWTFRKAPGFFDVVTYNGDPNNNVQSIAHNLGSVPGMVIVKRTDDSGPWICYHRSLGNTKNIELQSTNDEDINSAIWNNTTPTSTNFTVGSNANVNGSGRSYVAYIFAHDDAQFGTDSDESIIKCGSFTISSQAEAEVNLGFEPAFILAKNATDSRDWYLIDNMRGFGPNHFNFVRPNLSNAEGAKDYKGYFPTPTGFGLNPSINAAFTDGTYIYMAIRRPNKPPETGTDVFAVGRQGEVNGGSFPAYVSNFVVDMHFTKDVTSSSDNFNGARLLGENYLKTDANTSQTSRSWYDYDYMDGWGDTSNVNTNFYSWMFKRAPGFFDVVAYTGTGSNRTITHNLGSTPEFLIVKNRDSAGNWRCYHKDLASANDNILLNEDEDPETNAIVWNGTAPTSTNFSVGINGNVNDNTLGYVAYLFATLPGISKVGSYSGYTSNAVNVPCGFTAGARFILIKRFDAGSSGDWYVWDSTRGIVSGDDPYFLLNSTVAQVTNTDYIDPLATGFTVTASAPAALNATGGTYLFLAIA